MKQTDRRAIFSVTRVNWLEHISVFTYLLKHGVNLKELNFGSVIPLYDIGRQGRNGLTFYFFETWIQVNMQDKLWRLVSEGEKKCWKKKILNPVRYLCSTAVVYSSENF